MRAISEMYKRSGGTDYRNLCAECDNFFREQNRGKAEQRQGEPEREETGQISEQQEGVQMSIFDYPEYLSGRERT